LLEELENLDPEYVSFVPAKKSEPKIESLKVTPQASEKDYSRIKTNIAEVNNCLATICDNEEAIPFKLRKIKKFRSEF
jgi:septation ring formation regulator EzrA